jgi:hypothetical protein
VDDGNVLRPSSLLAMPKMTYDCTTDHYFTLLMVDIDYPARADIDRTYLLYWVVLNVNILDKRSALEVIVNSLI